MSEASRRRATKADLSALPSNVTGEILAGELVVSPRPAMPHAQASSTLGMLIGGPFNLGRGGPGGWWIVDEPELHLGEDVLVPDLAGWRRARVPELPDRPAMVIAPDWVCEVISPSTARADRMLKLPIYARERISHLWLIDPALRAIDVLILESRSWLLVASHVGGGSLRLPPFDAIEIDFSPLWGSEPGEASAQG